MDASHRAIRHLLHNLGGRGEVRQYLEAFAAGEDDCFAVLKIGGGILAEELDELASALAFLRNVGLLPVVVHGAGPQLDAALAEAGIETRRIDGHRVTSPEVLAVARRVFVRTSDRLADALERSGVRARPIPTGVLEARVASPELGLVGAVERIDPTPIRAALARRELPILPSLGETAGGQIVNVNADVAAREVAAALQPRKVIFLTPTGGLLDDRGRVIPAVNLAEDYDRLIAEPWVQGGMELKLREIKGLLDRLPESSSVSITAPRHLARELFTHRGDGTFIRRGVRIAESKGIGDLDPGRLAGVLEEAFGMPLATGTIDPSTFDRALVAGDHTAVALLVDHPDATYLDKFAVTAEAQGAGLGASLWSRLESAAPRLFWRSRCDNPINPWYLQRADGMRRCGRWLVFWRGFDEPDAIERCVDIAGSVPAAFVTSTGDPVEAGSASVGAVEPSDGV